MPVYRYQYTMFNAQRLALQVPGVITEGNAGPSVYKDITATTESKEDLDNYMASLGFTFVSTDPATTPSQQGSQSIAIASATVPGTVIISDTAPANVTKATAGPGVSTEVARRDHKHDITTAAPAAAGVGTTSGEGSATSLARSDHSHQSNTAPSNVTKATAAIGTSTEPARADHKHDVTTASASANPPGTANAEGSASSLARSDHAHQLATFGTAAGTFCQGNDSRLSDDRTASGLRTATTVVSVSGAVAPSSGQVLVALNSTAAEWGNASVVTDPLAIHKGTAAEISTITAKSPLVGNDLIVIEDSAAAYAKKSATLTAVQGFASKVKQFIHLDVTANTSTNSTSFTGNNLLSQAITTSAGTSLIIWFSVSCASTNSSASTYFQLAYDATPTVVRACGIRSPGGGSTAGGALNDVITGLSAGAHTIYIRWKVSGATTSINPVTLPDEHHASLFILETV